MLAYRVRENNKENATWEELRKQNTRRRKTKESPDGVGAQMTQADRTDELDTYFEVRRSSVLGDTRAYLCSPFGSSHSEPEGNSS